VLLHALNSALAALLAYWLFSWRTAARPGGLLAGAPLHLAAAVVGLGFALHPQHVESVAWLAERKDVLCGLFYLACLLAYLAYVERRAAGRPALPLYGLVVVLALLALLSKPMAVSLPAVMLILDWYPLGRLRSPADFRALGRLFLEKLPIVTLAAASCVVTVVAQQQAMTTFEYRSLSERLLAAPWAYVFYLRKFFWPAGLAVLYPMLRSVTWQTPGVLVAFLVLGALAAVSALSARRRPLLAAALAAFIVMLLPVIGLVQVGMQAAADRYMYLPALPVLLVVGAAAAWVYRAVGGRPREALAAKRAAAQGRTPVWLARGALLAALAAACAALAVMTHRQIAVWHDHLTLWTNCLERTGDNPDARYYYAAALLETGNPQVLGQAEALLKGLLSGKGVPPSNPGNVAGRLAAIHARRHDWNKARELAQQAFDAGRREQDRGYPLTSLAYVAIGEGRLEEGERFCRDGLKLDPDDPAAHYNLACALARMNRIDEALASLKAALECGYLFHMGDPAGAMLRDTDLDNLKGDQRYKELLRRHGVQVPP
jgi:tetratricopeptide (TPR) repeat protein